MGYKPHRSDYTDYTESLLYKPMPMNNHFIEAESIYDFLFPEKLWNGKKIRSRAKGADFTYVE